MGERGKVGGGEGGEEKLSVLRRRRKRRRRNFCGRAHGRAGQSKVVQEVLVDPKKIHLERPIKSRCKTKKNYLDHSARWHLWEAAVSKKHGKGREIVLRFEKMGGKRKHKHV